jgi:hypothetical protein
LSNNLYNLYNFVARAASSEFSFGNKFLFTSYPQSSKTVFSQGKMCFHKGHFNYEPRLVKIYGNY